MKLRLLWVGKTQEEWVRRGIAEYEGRLKRYFPCDIIEVKEEKGAPAELQRRRETERAEKALPKNALLVILDERGEEMTSPELASFMERQRDRGTQELVLAVGGAYGFTDEFKKSATLLLSLSRLTFTHQMIRPFLLEQLYRAATIMAGEGYHH